MKPLDGLASSSISTSADAAAVAEDFTTQQPFVLDPTSRRRAKHHWLDRIASAITSPTALDEVMRLVYRGVLNTCGFDRTAIFLYNADQHMLQGVWGTDCDGKLVDISTEQLPVAVDDMAPICRIVRGELPHYLTVNHSEHNRLPSQHRMHSVRAHAQAPICINGKVAGVLCADNLMSDRPITDEDLEDLKLFARQAALAIHTTELMDEIQHAQNTLVRSEKLRAVGELASGVAHNINNVLAAVQGYSELIQDAPGVGAEIGHYARVIERAIQDGAAMVQRIQQFARTEDESGSTLFDFSLVAREAIDLTRPAWRNQAQGRGIEVAIVTELAPGLQAYGKASEIREVLVNLVNNAVDAMPAGGVVTVRCFARNKECVCTVTDTGAGMHPEIRRRIFEPFFTTKSNGRGTGLGLSVAWGIIVRHNGRIWVESEIGHGATFSVTLPRIDGETAESPSSCYDSSLNGLRVLLVEDEEIVAGSMARVLTAAGAVVSLAQDASEALAWLGDHADECDAVLSDHGLTGCTGLDLLETVRTSYSHVRRVLVSGWGVHLPGVTDTAAAEVILAKPVCRDQLVAALASPPR